MGKVNLNSLLAPDSPIYNQSISIGTRFTKRPLKPKFEAIDLQKLSIDPLIEATMSRERAIKKKPKQRA